MRRSLSADGSLSESLNSDDLMLDVDYDQTDDKLVDADNEDLLKTLESTKQNAFNEWKSLTSPRWVLNNNYVFTWLTCMKYYVIT